MRIEPVPDEPAVLVNGSIIAVADLHIGMEAELGKAGVFLPSQTAKMARRLKSIVEDAGADIVVILGDVKHYIPGTAALERRDLPLFFETLLEIASEVHVATGNHDALIKPYMPKKIKFHRSGGFVIGDAGFVHGHAWPTPSVMRCQTLFMGHNHPAVVLVDELGGRSIIPCWVRLTFRKGVEGHPRMPQNGLLVPSFNELCGGAAVNDVHTKLLGPLATDEVANLSAAKVHLLDGTYLGILRNLVVDSGLRPRDFRQ